MLAYLSRYTHRVAISNTRLIAHDERGVTFRYKDYRADGLARHKAMTLATDEFIRRFMLHILPKGFHRIRHYGLFASTGRAANIARLRELLGATPPAEASASPGQDQPAEPRAGEEHFVVVLVAQLFRVQGQVIIVPAIFERGGHAGVAVGVGRAGRGHDVVVNPAFVEVFGQVAAGALGIDGVGAEERINGRPVEGYAALPSAEIEKHGVVAMERSVHPAGFAVRFRVRGARPTRDEAPRYNRLRRNKHQVPFQSTDRRSLRPVFLSPASRPGSGDGSSADSAGTGRFACN